MTHGQKNDCTVRLFAQRRVLRDHRIGGGKMPAVGDERTFRVTGGAGRVDDKGRIFRRQPSNPRLQPIELRFVCNVQQLAQAMELGMRVAEHGRIIDYDDGLQIGKPIGEGENLVDVFLIFSDEERGAAVAHLVFDFGLRGRRINAVGDRPKRLDGEIA